MLRRSLVLAGIFVVGIAEAQPAQPVATLAVDLDGDGKADAIELYASGQLVFRAAQRREIRIAPSASQGALALARYRGRRYVVAQLAQEAVILLEDGATWREVVRTPIGGRGLDGEYGVAIDATDDGIYRYQTRGDIRRCDGKPAYLFAEKLDGERFRRASALPSRIDAAAPALQARRDDGAAAAPLVYQARAASHQVGASDASALAIPRELDDGKLDTVWREDLVASTGEGQFFTFEARAPGAKAAQLRIAPGDPTKRANRPRTLAIAAAKAAWRVELPDAPGAAFVVDLPPTEGCVTVILESTYGGPRGATAIAELEVFAEGERAGGGEAVLARAVADGGDGAIAAATALARRGAAATTAIEAALQATTDPGRRRRLVGALARVQDPSAQRLLAHAARAGWVRDRALLEVIEALRDAATLRALIDDEALAIEVRVAAVAQLPTTDAAVLLELAGRGPHALRRAVIARMATLPMATLLAATSGTDAAIGDAWRAATKRARRTDAERATGVGAMSAALPGARGYEQRYRLVDGLATLGDAARLQQLDAWLRALPQGVERAALEQVAVHAVADRDDATAFVLARAQDASPGVRLAALAVLDGRSEASADDVLAEALARDAWPEVRQRAAAALGARCERPGPAASLTTAVERDRDAAVRGDAIAALVRCRAVGVAALLARTWDDARAPIELRTRAVLEAGALDEPAIGRTLIARLGAWRGDAIHSAEALALAQSAAATVGRLAPPGAGEALASMLDDALPELVQSAAVGLAALGPACPAAAKAKLARVAQSDSMTAPIARRAAQQCGAPR